MQTTLSSQSNITFFRSIQGQLVIWFLMLGLLPLAVIGFASYFSGQGALQAATQDSLTAVTEAKAQRVEAWLTDSKGIAEVLADQPAIHGDIVLDIHLGIEDIQRYKNDNANRDAYQIAYQTALDTMQAFQETYDQVEYVFVTATNGDVVVSTSEEYAEGSNVSGQTFVIEGLKDSFIGAPRIDPHNENSLDLYVSAPVHNENNQVIGVVVVELNSSTINSMMADNTGLGQTGETYLVATINDQNLMLTQSRDITESTLLKQTVNTKGVTQAAAGNDNGVGDYANYHDAKVVGAWHTIPQTGWVLLAEIDQAEAYNAAQDLGMLILGIAAGAALVILLAAYVIARTIARPLTLVTDAAVRIAEGDLSHRARVNNRNETGVLAQTFNSMTDSLQDLVESEQENRLELERIVNEYMIFVEEVAQGNLATRLSVNGNGHQDDVLNRLGSNLNVMVESLSTITLQIREVASNVAAAAAEILAATTQQTASTTEQDTAVTQTLATAEEVQTTVSQTADRAQGVAQASQSSVATSRDGQQSIVNSIDGMQLIRQQVENIAENILLLSERTQQIGEIIDTVNEIADQSKLLALNASIEAARAGEEGKGFAVVAQEVRQLAEQSRAATARVAEILGEIQQATNTAVMVTEEGSKRVEAGVELVERAGEAIRELAATIEEAAQAATQIAASTQQQTNGMDQLTTAMASIQQASSQTAASTRQAEQSARDLDEMAREMNEAVARYRL